MHSCSHPIPYLPRFRYNLYLGLSTFPPRFIEYVVKYAKLDALALRPSKQIVACNKNQLQARFQPCLINSRIFPIMQKYRLLLRHIHNYENNASRPERGTTQSFLHVGQAVMFSSSTPASPSHSSWQAIVTKTCKQDKNSTCCPASFQNIARAFIFFKAPETQGVQKLVWHSALQPSYN